MRTLSRSFQGIRDRINIFRRPVDKPAGQIHRDLLSSLLSPRHTRRAEKDYWERRGASNQNDQDVLWTNPEFRQVEEKHITYLSNLCRDKEVLDVGAGWGRMGVKLLGSYRTYTGLEQSSTMIARAANGLHIVQGSGVNMPFPNESFDVVLMVICVSSVRETIFEIYDESLRCLRASGIFVISEPSVTVIFEKPFDES